jgi:hypothetical protein
VPVIKPESDACALAAECVVMPPVNECYVDVCVCASECESECAYPFLLCNPPANLLHHQRKLSR